MARRSFRNLILSVLAVLLLSGCTASRPEQILSPTAVQTQPPAVNQAVPPVTTQPPTIPATEEPTQPPHSPYYLSGIPAEDVITYFLEVCLSAEFINSGDPSYLQRWQSPIRYTLLGDFTQEDAETVSEFSQWLNTVEGFPGMAEAEDGLQANLSIYFCNGQELTERMGSHFSNADGAVTFWYDGENAIYDAIICIRSDIGQQLRNSVILEELYNGLGPIQDTSLRTDSIIYAEFSQPQALTAVDELILRLLYHPDLSCGMNRAQCEAAIRRLYY